MPTNSDAGSILPSKITEGAAWSAFQYVVSIPWEPRFTSDAPMHLDIDWGDEFSACLNGVGSADYRNQARLFVATRLIEIAGAIDDRQLRLFGVHPERLDPSVLPSALGRIKDLIAGRLREELSRRFDGTVATWEVEADRAVRDFADEEMARQVKCYLGLDQRSSPSSLRKAVKYVFRPDWKLGEHSGGMVVIPDWRLKEVNRKWASENDADRARNLVARAVYRLVELYGTRHLSVEGASPINVEWLRSEIDRRVAEKGEWGLIDLTLPADRERHKLVLPSGLPESVLNLVSQLEGRCQGAILPLGPWPMS